MGIIEQLQQDVNLLRTQVGIYQYPNVGINLNQRIVNIEAWIKKVSPVIDTLMLLDQGNQNEN